MKIPEADLPSISVIIPTLNSERTLELCLSSIASQLYQGKIEIVIADGGSSDRTLQIARKYHARIVKNKLKTGEAGKAVGVKYAKGEILALIDSDNILPESDWFEKMTEPFRVEKEIIASEPLYFEYREQDQWLTRYFSLLGMGDPLSLFIGYYDRYSFISNKWTELPIKYNDMGSYLVLSFKHELLTIGANGFLIKRSELNKYPIKDYLFDIDVLRFLAKRKSIKLAKVKVGIVHLFTDSISSLARKQKRRIKDFLFFQEKGMRVQKFKDGPIFWGVIKFVVATVIILPILWQTIKGFSRKPDLAWLFHPFACWLTLWIYSTETIKTFFVHKQEIDRGKWRQ